MLNPLVRLVDDDTHLLHAQAFVLRLAGLETAEYASAEEFLAQDDSRRPGCVVLDIRMEGMNGLQCQDRMHEAGIDLPILFLTGHGDVQMAVLALKNGAADFRQKPLEAEDLIKACRTLVDWNVETRRRLADVQKDKSLVETLTEREKQVAELSALGLTNREIAQRLGITEKAIKFHRTNIYRKLGVHSAVQVSELLETAQDEPARDNGILTLKVLE